MQDQVAMTFTTERHFQAEFHSALAQNNTTANDAFNDFMGDYIRLSKQRKDGVASITEEEKQARRAGVEMARASVALEGFPVDDPEELARDERYINGEMTLEEYVDPSRFEPISE